MTKSLLAFVAGLCFVHLASAQEIRTDFKVIRGGLQTIRSDAALADRTFFGVPLGGVIERCVDIKKCMDEVGLEGKFAKKHFYWMNFFLEAARSPIWLKEGFKFKVILNQDAVISAINFELPFDAYSVDPKDIQVVYAKMVERLGQPQDKTPTPKAMRSPGIPALQFTAIWLKDWGYVRFATYDGDGGSPRVTIFVQSNELSQAMDRSRQIQRERDAKRDAGRPNF